VGRLAGHNQTGKLPGGGALILVLAAAGAGFGVGQWLADRGHTERFTEQLRQVQARIGRIDAALAGITASTQETAGAKETQAHSTTDQALAAMQQRLDMVEAQLSALSLSQPPLEPEETPPPGGPEPIAGPEGSPEAAPPHGVTVDYQKDSGESAWGKAAAQRIQDGYQTDPYFAHFGGSLTTTCKQQTCRIEWSLPDLDTLSSEDKQEVLATAGYQLMALATRNAAQVGRISTQWTGSDNDPALAVVFQRAGGN
jgi:hypothetical protein